jgi:hypothetical protein
MVKKGDDIAEENQYSVTVIDKPIHDVDPADDAMVYYKPGQEVDAEDEEEMAKI